MSYLRLRATREQLHEQHHGDTREHDHCEGAGLKAAAAAAARITTLPVQPPRLCGGLQRAWRHERPPVGCITSLIVCCRRPGHRQRSTTGGTSAAVARYIQLRIEDASMTKNVRTATAIQQAERIHLM